MSGRQQDRGRSRGGRAGGRSTLPFRGRGGGSALFSSSGINREESQGVRGSNITRRGGDRGRAPSGYGRGRGGPVEVEVFLPNDGIPTQPSLQVQKIESEVETAALVKGSVRPKGPESETHLPRRPGYGTQGKPVTLWTNYFELLTTGDPLLHRYSIEILPDESGRIPVGKKVRRIVELLLDDHLHTIRQTIATDYKSNLICKSETAIEDDTYAIQYRQEAADELPGTSQIYQLRLRNTGTFRLSELTNYLTSTSAGAMFGSKDEIIQALNIVVGNHPKNDPEIFSVGANKYFRTHPPQTEVMNLGAGLHAIRGLFFSVRAATSRILLNVQVKHVACYDEGPLGRLMSCYLDENSQNMVKLAKFLRRVKVQVTHIIRKNRKGEEIPRIKTIAALAMPGDGGASHNPPIIPRYAAGAKEVKFFLGDPGTQPGKNQPRAPGQGKKKTGKEAPMPDSGTPQTGYISVYDFFQRTYNIAIQSPGLPVINVGSRENPSYLPADVCFVLPGQASSTKLSPFQTQQMIRFAVRRPAQNAQSIVTNGPRFLGGGPSMNSNLAAFGIEMPPRLIQVPGRVLIGPDVMYRDNKAASTRFGSWNMQYIKFSTTGTLSSWTHLAISLEGSRDAWNNNDQELNTTIQLFQQKLQEVGINASAYTAGLRISLSATNSDAQIEAAINRFFSHATRSPPKLLLVILPFPDTATYNRIKYLCDVKKGLLNVCVVGSKFAKERNDQYFANVALKFNLKLGGRNQSLRSSKIGIIQEGKTMVVGLDVTHPSPGSASNAPSIAGIVASVDQWLGQWPADLRIQTGRQEMIAELDSLLKSRLRLWAKHNKDTFPENILVYRDGVSEGQYNTVLSEELPLLRKACGEVYPAGDTKKGFPSMTIVIVGKRHNTRFYPTNKDDADRSSNPQNGTVVDRGVTEARNWDFFLQAHSALQGTARPAHYFVVLDEIFHNKKAHAPFQNAADALEDLTHNMCYLFGRATKAVSICPAAYYADLVCERARCYLSRLFDMTPTLTPEGSTSGGATGGGGPRQADPNEVRIHEIVRDTMFYI